MLSADVLTKEASNHDIPERFIEIDALLRRHDKNIRKMAFKVLNDVFFQEDEDSNNEVREVIEYAICLNKRRDCSFFIKLIGDMFEINRKSNLFLCTIIDLLEAYSSMRTAMPDFENNDYIQGSDACHKKFNKTITLVAMDSLLSLVFETISCSKIVSFTESDRCRLSGIVGKYTGNCGLGNGDMMKLLFKKKKRSCCKDEITRIKRLESRALFFLGLECLFVLSKKTEEEQFLIKGCVNNFCCMVESLCEHEINDNYGSRLEQAELLLEQAKQNIAKTNYDTENIIKYIDYSFHCLSSVLKDDVESQPLIIESDSNRASV